MARKNTVKLVKAFLTLQIFLQFAVQFALRLMLFGMQLPTL